MIQEQIKMENYAFLVNSEMNKIEILLGRGDSKEAVKVISNLDQLIQDFLDAENTVFKKFQHSF